MEMHTWYYFLALERDLSRATEFVEINDHNYGTYSNWFAKLLLLVGSEVDVVAKQLCMSCPGGDKAKKIDEYREVITKNFPGMQDFAIDVPRYSISLKPWKSWAEAPPKTPQWWRDYNSVKHERNANFKKANLENVLMGFAGLLVLELYYYREEKYHEPYPDLFNAGFPSIVVSGRRPKLPGL